MDLYFCLYYLIDQKLADFYCYFFAQVQIYLLNHMSGILWVCIEYFNLISYARYLIDRQGD